MTTFDFLWQMLDKHGVIERYKGDCFDLWNTFSLEQQRLIYRSIRDKICAGQFVNYHPVKAIRDNIPVPPKKQVLTMSQYYDRFHTTGLQPGWRTENPTGQQVLYVK